MKLYSGVALAVVVAVILALGVALWIYLALNTRARRTIRALRAAPATPIAELAAGTLAKVVGAVVVGAEPIRAPLGRHACTFCITSVQSLARTRRSRYWAHEAWATTGELLVSDGTGTVRVAPERLSPALRVDHGEATGALRGLTPELEAFLVAQGKDPTKLVGAHRALRAREHSLTVGDRVAVLGVVAFEFDADAGAAGEGFRGAPRRAVLRAPPDGLLLLSDDRRAWRGE